MPETTTILSGYTVLCCGPNGSVDTPRHGLLYRDTRILSRYRLTIDGRTPEPVGASRPELDRWDAVLRLGRPGGHAAGPLLPQDALEIHVWRRVGPALREELVVVNHSAVSCETTLRVELDADFRDIAELGSEPQIPGTTTRSLEADRRRVRFDHIAEHEGRRFERTTRIEILEATSPPEVEQTGFSFALRLDPRASWQVTWEVAALDSGEWVSPAGSDDDTRSRQRRTWRRVRPTVEAADRLRRPFDRAADDLFDLRNWELERRFLGSTAGAEWVVNAGAPMFTGLFGRDILTAGWQSAMLGTRALRGALGL